PLSKQPSATPGGDPPSRRRLVHFNVTEHPTAEWTARQLLEACAQEKSARDRIRDSDGTRRYVTCGRRPAAQQENYTRQSVGTEARLEALARACHPRLRGSRLRMLISGPERTIGFARDVHRGADYSRSVA